jgi:hypothetical protein
MHFTIELLIKGDKKVCEYYQKAAQHWEEIWALPASRNVRDLAPLLSDEQTWFENNCGGGRVGQEIMAVSGIGMLYTTGPGFGDQVDKARLLYDAFQQSYCSLEVKIIARDIAQSYLLEEKVNGYAS